MSSPSDPGGVARRVLQEPTKQGVPPVPDRRRGRVSRRVSQRVSRRVSRRVGRSRVGRSRVGRTSGLVVEGRPTGASGPSVGNWGADRAAVGKGTGTRGSPGGRAQDPPVGVGPEVLSPRQTTAEAAPTPAVAGVAGPAGVAAPTQVELAGSAGVAAPTQVGPVGSAGLAGSAQLAAPVGPTQVGAAAARVGAPGAVRAEVLEAVRAEVLEAVRAEALAQAAPARARGAWRLRPDRPSADRSPCPPCPARDEPTWAREAAASVSAQPDATLHRRRPRTGTASQRPAPLSDPEFS